MKNETVQSESVRRYQEQQEELKTSCEKHDVDYQTVRLLLQNEKDKRILKKRNNMIAIIDTVISNKVDESNED